MAFRKSVEYEITYRPMFLAHDHMVSNFAGVGVKEEGCTYRFNYKPVEKRKL
jgi:hypothetical protein